jgi:hypothetical protein
MMSPRHDEGWAANAAAALTGAAARASSITPAKIVDRQQSIEKIDGDRRHMEQSRSRLNLTGQGYFVI